MKRKTILILAFVTLVGLGCVAAFAHSFEAARNASLKIAETSPGASEASTTDQSTSTVPGALQASMTAASATDHSTSAGPGKAIIPIRRTPAKPIPDSLGGPQSLSELVASANVIVIGKVSALLDTQIFYGYDAGAVQRSELDKGNSPPRLGIPIADYSVTIERILLGDGKIAQGGTLTLRVPGTPGVDSGMPQLGSRRLFFLTTNPDATTYGMPSVLDEIDLTGSTTMYQAGGSDVLPFGMAQSPDEFVSSVGREVSQQTGTLSK